MTSAIPALSHRRRPWLAAICLCAATVVSAPVLSGPALARGPDGIADVAEKVIDAVVNISTSQTVEAKGGAEGRGAIPQLPPGSPFEEFFDDFFKNRRGGPGGNSKGGDRGADLQPRKTNSLGSGFIVDTAGIAVTNNHVIADADEINIIMNDGTKIKAELVGVDKKTDLAVLKFKPPAKPLGAVKFGDSDKLRLGEWVIAIGNPFSLGGTVTAGIVSARNRDISSGPYDNYIQTDAAINRGNSGGPLFNLDGEVIGVNTLIISPSGGSIGIGFAVPSKTVAGVVDSLRQFGELRRGWLGVRIQQVTDEIAESLNIKPARGALTAGVENKGPPKPAGSSPAMSWSSSTARTSRSQRTCRASWPTPRSARKSMSSSSARGRRKPRRSCSAASRMARRRCRLRPRRKPSRWRSRSRKRRWASISPASEIGRASC